MDISIDTVSGEPYGDEVVDEGLVEVEEVPVVPEGEMRRPPPSAPKKKDRKKPLLIVAVVFMIIVISLIAYVLYPRAPTDITLTASLGQDEHSMFLNAGMHTSSYTESSGTGTLIIKYGGEEAYRNENWKIDSNSESLTIPFSEFVMGNGLHTIEMEFEGVTGTTTFEIKHVVEEATIIADGASINKNTEEATFNLRVNVETASEALPRDTEIKIKSIEHEDGIHDVTSGIGDWEDMSGQAQYQGTITYEESGNYTITVEIRNNDVKSTSDFYEIEFQDTALINAAPVAKIHTEENDGSEDGQVSTGTEVHFEATVGVYSIDDGNNIVSYEWFFADTKQTLFGAEVDHTFNTLNPTPDENGWTVTLTITDQGHGEEGKTDFDQVYIIVTF